MNHFRRTSSLALLLLASTLSAVAQKPTITEIPFTTPFEITGGPANGACNFNVLVSPQTGRPNTAREIDFANTSILSGPIFVTLTNESTGKSINLNISGPSKVTFVGGIPTQQVFLGPTLLAEFPPNLMTAAGLPPGVAVINGRTVITFDAQGNITSLSSVGTAQDVCKLLE